MTIQRNNNILVAIRREATINVQATATGATQVRLMDSPGLTITRAQIASSEQRTDLLKQLPRLGYKSVAGSYNTEMTVGGHTDLLLESLIRTTWATATTVAFSTMTIAITTNALTATAGSFLTNGVKVGDIFTLSGTSLAADNGLNTRVVAVTTLTLTTPPAALTTLAATVTGTLTILKKITSPAAPTRYSYTVEQYDADTDLSEVFTGCRLVGGKVSCKPGQPATIAYTFMGADHIALATGTSPYFTTPSLTTGLALITEDSSLRYNGAVAVNFTGVDIDFSISSKGEAVIGSLVTPDIFDDDMTVTASITALRSDLSNLTLFDAETEFDLSIKLEEPNTGPPKSCLAFFLPRVKIGALSAPVGGGDGAKTETIQLLVGPKVAATGYDAGIISIHSSAP